MYFTDRGLEELEERRGQDRVTLGWLAERLREFIDLHPDATSPVDALATWLAQLDEDPDPREAPVSVTTCRHDISYVSKSSCYEGRRDGDASLDHRLPADDRSAGHSGPAGAGDLGIRRGPGQPGPAIAGRRQPERPAA